MSTAFSNALAGLNANSLAIDTVSGNLANLNTAGYMDSAVSFTDLLTGTEVTQVHSNQAGTVVAKSAAEFSQGAIQTTNQPFDASIQGNGFFVLQNSNGQTAYTRAGNFTVDSDGALLGPDGEAVQGWNATNGVLSTSGVASAIILPTGGSQQPVAPTNFSLSANLSADATVGSSTGTFSSPIQIYDSHGASHTLTVTYTETAPNTWSYDIGIPSTDLTGGTGTSTSLGTGTLTFDSSGKLTGPAVGAPVPVTITGLSDGAADMNVNWNLYDSSGVPTLTQFSGAATNLASKQDGSAPGQLTGTSIGDSGKITATYSNGASIVVGQLAIASILNPDSMQNLGNNTFAITTATATPIIGTSGTGSRGSITGGTLESSTVDIATEFTNLLTYERGYQANSKVITTEDTIMQTTVGLIQG